MKEFNVYLFIMTFLIISCRTIKDKIIISPCNNKVYIKFDKVTKNDIDEGRVVNFKTDGIMIFFEDYFDGRVKIFYNDKLVFNEILQTDESLGTTEKFFKFKNIKWEDKPKIKVVYGNNCVEIPFIKKYKFIYLSFNKGEWEILFSNVIVDVYE